jgi:hypothetical protein
VVSGAGERPAKSSLTSPVYALPDCSPLRRALAYLAYTYSQSARVPLSWKCPQALAVSGSMVRRGRPHSRSGCRAGQSFVLAVTHRIARI